MDTVLKALVYAIRMEKEGESFYRQNAERIKSSKAKAVFENLASMEKEHQEFLEKQYHALMAGNPWSEIDALKQEDYSFFEKRQGEEKIAPSEIESVLGDIPILRLAYLLENDLAEYYKKTAEETADEKGRTVFRMLSQWEIKHRDMLLAEYKRLMESNWFESGFAPF